MWKFNVVWGNLLKVQWGGSKPLAQRKKRRGGDEEQQKMPRSAAWEGQFLQQVHVGQGIFQSDVGGHGCGACLSH